MTSASSYPFMAIFMTLALLACFGSAASDELSTVFYSSYCPKLSPIVCDNSYYKNLSCLEKRGYSTPINMQLFRGGQTDSLVKTYGDRKPENLLHGLCDGYASFRWEALTHPIISPSGEIRFNCRRFNLILPPALDD